MSRMFDRAKSSAVSALRWSEKYTKTDMVYLAQGGFWLIARQVGAIIISLGLAVFFGHFATQDTYGNYKYIIDVSFLLTTISLSGLTTAVTRAAARGDGGGLRQGFTLSMRWSWGIILIGFITSLYYFYLGNNFVGIGLALAAATLPLISGLSLYDSFLIGLKEFRLSSLYSIGSLAFTALSLIATLLFVSQRAIVLVAVYFITNLMTDALWYILSLRKAQNASQDPEMLHYGFHLSLMGVIGTIADKIDSIIVFSLLGPAQLAVYLYAIAIPEQIKGLLKNIGTLGTPAFARRSLSEIKSNIWNRILLLSLGTLGVMCVYALMTPFIFKIFFPVYISSIPYSQIYAFSIVFSGIVPIMSIFQAHKNVRELYIVSNVGPILLIIIFPIFTAYWGISGAIISQVVYRFVTTSVAIFLFLRLKQL